MSATTGSAVAAAALPSPQQRSASSDGSPVQPSIPVIDLRAFREGTPAQRADVARAFDAAFRTVGFCCVENYDSGSHVRGGDDVDATAAAANDDTRGQGLTEITVQALRREAMRWFTKLPHTTKNTAYADGMVGYIGQGLENVSASAGDSSNSPDLVESLNFPGYQEPGAGWDATAVLSPTPAFAGSGGNGGSGGDVEAAPATVGENGTVTAAKACADTTSSNVGSGGGNSNSSNNNNGNNSNNSNNNNNSGSGNGPARSPPGGFQVPWAAAPWLADPAHAALRARAAEYWVGATRLMYELQELAEVALGLPAGFFRPSYRCPGTLLRLAFYPPTTAAGTATATATTTTATVDATGAGPGGDGAGRGAESAGTSEAKAWRYGAHTDYDGFTILQREELGAGGGGGGGAGLSDTGGLEIEMPDGSWCAVPARPGTLTINIGDLMARWTNDRWKATRHRVAPPPPGSAAASQPRLSLVYFTGPHPDTVVECLPSPACAPAPGARPKYPPITAADHVMAKIKAATAAGIAAVEAAAGDDADQARASPGEPPAAE